MVASHRSADEAKANNILAMGEELGTRYDAIWQQVVWLYSKWEEYVELYGTKPSRVELLNKAAPTFFKIIQDSLWDDIIIHISRLTDSPKSAGKSNLSVRLLPNAIKDETLKAKVNELVEIALEVSKFCRDWRNRRIAHRDLHLALGLSANPLEPASREKVKIALKALTNILNAVSYHYCESTTIFDLKDGSGGAVSLLYLLDDGIKVEALRRERKLKGTFSFDDYIPKDI